MSDLDVAQWALLFAAGASVLVWAGAALAKAGDEIATRTGMGHMFVGVIFLAGATSLPEVVTDVAAVRADAPDLAVGDLFGSSMANMAILAVIDLVHRKHVWRHVVLTHARVGSIAVALTSIAVLGIVTPDGPRIGWVGFDTALIAGGYIAAVAWTRRVPASRGSTAPVQIPAPTGIGEAEHPRGELRGAIRRFVVAALAVLAIGPVVAFSGKGLADASGLGETFVGVVLIAVSTSLPELASSLGAVRIGAYDLAVGNLFGSNALNMAILFIADLALTSGPILSGLDRAQVVAGIGAILLMGIAMAAIIHGEETRIARLEPDAVVLLLTYVGVLAAMWSVR